MTYDVLEPETPDPEEKPGKVDKYSGWRRCQRKLNCKGAKAVNQFWDGMEPIMVCPACQTEAERRLVKFGPYYDHEPPLVAEEGEG